MRRPQFRGCLLAEPETLNLNLAPHTLTHKPYYCKSTEKVSKSQQRSSVAEQLEFLRQKSISSPAIDPQVVIMFCPEELKHPLPLCSDRFLTQHPKP